MVLWPSLTNKPLLGYKAPLIVGRSTGSSMMAHGHGENRASSALLLKQRQLKLMGTQVPKSWAPQGLWYPPEVLPKPYTSWGGGEWSWESELICPHLSWHGLSLQGKWDGIWKRPSFVQLFLSRAQAPARLSSAPGVGVSRARSHIWNWKNSRFSRQ